MLIDDSHRILKNLRGPISIPSLFQLNLMEAELIQQALAQVPAGYSGRIQLLHNLQ